MVDPGARTEGVHLGIGVVVHEAFVEGTLDGDVVGGPAAQPAGAAS
jgi:hypothetical protein